LRDAGLEPQTQADLERHIPFEQRAASWRTLDEAGSLHRLEGGYVHEATVVALAARAVELAAAFCREHPYRAGFAREALQAELQVPPGRLAHILTTIAARGAIRMLGRLVAPADHTPIYAGDAARAAEPLESRLQGGLLYDEADLLRDLPDLARQILEDWAESGHCVRIGGGIFATPASLEAIKAKLQAQFAMQPQMTASQLRDVLETSRKFIIPLLEHLDTTGFTRRQGDIRTLAPAR
jgi:selenocysteine-specific elongation factor